MAEDLVKKVVILGSGMGAMTAAFQLSEHGGYDITVYQPGWRLGGQGASGRNLNQAGRIEEHGLHVWFGFYENAFQVMRRCYEELGRPRNAALANIKMAFHAVDSFTMIEKYQGQRLQWAVEFPTNDYQPGDGYELFTLWGSMVLILKWMVEFAEGKPIDSSFNPPTDRELSTPSPAIANSPLTHLPDWIKTSFAKIEMEIEGDVHKAEFGLLRLAFHYAASLPSDHTQHTDAHHSILAWLIKEFVKKMWSRVEGKIEQDTDTRRLWTLLYLGCTSIAGMLNDRVLWQGFDPLDQYDLMEWFYQHQLVSDPRANEIAFRSAPTQTVYDLVFHYVDGEINHPRLSAGIALRMLIFMLFQYKGSMMWFMQAGMGDTVFAPLYQVLVNRGVKFEFFHRVVNLGLSPDKTSVETVKISRQVNLKVGQYDPLVLIKDLPCWPSEPLYDQIVEGEQLCEEHVNLEHARNGWQDTGGEIILEAGRDFDAVILGIGIGALPPLVTELTQASAAWQKMIDNIKTVPTQAIQLWLKPDSDHLGVQGYRPVIGAYAEPYSSLTDFSDLIPRENWPPSAGLNSIYYSCGVIKDLSNESQADADRRAYHIARDFLKSNASPLWPKATEPSDPDELDWDKLVAPDYLNGEARFEAQYWRANIDPVERYVLSLPGTNQYRMKAGKSGFKRLILTGNWIDTGFNIACIESAAMSGLQAARALTGVPDKIPGEITT